VEKMKTVLSNSGYDITPLSREEVARLAKKLDPEAYRVTQKAGTEAPFCGNLLDNKKEGTYLCVVCGLPSSRASTSSTRGPAGPASSGSSTRPTWLGPWTARSEWSASRSTAPAAVAHLGHVFPDGPPADGRTPLPELRLADLPREGGPVPPESRPVKAETAYFAAGCFWGVQHWFSRGPGVLEATSGYMQGRTEKPTYRQVCDGDTGHAETVKVVYDANRISYRRLVEAFFAMHDPTQLNRQGPDVGDQYRSGIWTVDAEQARTAREVLAGLEKGGAFGGKKVVTLVEPAKAFWPAEEYHQEYLAKNGASCHVTNPW
jgi:methionine-S-sulfoxide reductase